MEVYIKTRNWHMALAIVVVGLLSLAGMTLAQGGIVGHTWDQIGVGETGYCMLSLTQSTCPAGYTKHTSTAHNNRFFKMAANAGQIGGTNTHNHSFTTPGVTGRHFTYGSGGHTAYAAQNLVQVGYVNTVTYMPEYVDAILCCRST